MAASSPTTKQLCLFVELRVAPENADEFLKALRPCWEGCAGEPECIYFDVFQHPDTPGLFRFIELWTKDREWFETKQLTKSYYEPYISITKPMWIADRKMDYFEREPGWSVFTDKYLDGGKRIG